MEDCRYVREAPRALTFRELLPFRDVGIHGRVQCFCYFIDRCAGRESARLRRNLIAPGAVTLTMQFR